MQGLTKYTINDNKVQERKCAGFSVLTVNKNRPGFRLLLLALAKILYFIGSSSCE
jgi:hypothetical protein